MGQAIPSRQPAVVLDSRLNQLRALLAVALIAVGGLTAAVIGLATDNKADVGAANVSWSRGVTQDQAVPGLARQAKAAQAGGVRYDGGPEEGTRGRAAP